jgi:hypothetical protein
MDVPNLLQELQPYLNSDATLIDAGNGNILSKLLTSRYHTHGLQV